MHGQYSDVDVAKDRAMDEAPVGIVLSDPHAADNPLIYVNETFVDLTGYARDEILGQNCRFLQGPETDDATVSAMSEAIDNESPVTVEVLNFRKDGDAFWNEVTIAPVYDDAGRLLHFVGFQSDVTQRKEAEIALKQRTDELEHLIDRLNGLLQDITEELMHATSRDETEVAICERLIATDLYRFAWVGVLDPVTETIQPTNWRGTVGLTETSIEGSVAERFSAALNHGGVEIVSEEDALERIGAPAGVAAAALIPLRYRTHRYGVVVVGVDQIESLDEPEPTVLGSLGRTIATAIHAAQTRRQLADDSRVVATFRIDDTSFVPLALARHGEVDLSFEGSVEHRDGSASMFFTTTGSIEVLNDAIGEVPNIESITEINRFEDGALIEVRASAPSDIAWLAQLGGSIASLAITDGQADLEVEFLPTVDGRAVANEIQDRYQGTDLLSYRSEERPPHTREEFRGRLTDRLTDRQHLVLKRAYLSGFYDSTRQITGSELASSMDISRSTFHQHRRAAERKLIEEFFS